MAIIQPPSVPTGPTTAPQRGNKATFSAAFEAFLTWFLPNFTTIATAINSAYNNALEALGSANTATSAAAAAQVTANAAPWVSGTNYLQYANAISTMNFQTYRCKVGGSSTTDPAQDPTKWEMVGPSISSIHAAQLSFY